ncbi:MAG: hypothetical protein ACE5H4_07560 [Candidatus Thorarchaeota archaeon]
MMNGTYETISLKVNDYISPECSCKIEDMVNAIPHVVDSAFDPINHLLSVKVHQDMVSAGEVIEGLRQCAIRCEERKPSHEMAHIEHEATRMHKPAAHDHHAMMEVEMKRHFLVAALFTVPVLILSPSIQQWLGFSLPSNLALDILLVLSASVVIVYGGLVFYKGSLRALRIRTLDMSVLVTIALLAGYLYSLGTTFLFDAPDFYWEISTLASFILFGHWMEMRAQRTASGALKELVKLIPP